MLKGLGMMKYALSTNTPWYKWAYVDIGILSTLRKKSDRLEKAGILLEGQGCCFDYLFNNFSLRNWFLDP